MTKELNKEIHQYLKQITLLLPLKGKEEKFFLRHLRSSIEDFADANPDCTMEDIIENFDSPEDVVHGYLSAADHEELYKKISIRKYIRRGIVITILLLVIFTVFRMALFYDIYLEEKKTIIEIEETVIE